MDFLIWARNQWDRVLAWVVVAIGALVLILGWIGVTSTPYTFEQIPYVISGGLGGIFLLGVAAMLWISADLRDEWRVLNELLERDEQRDQGDIAPPNVLQAQEPRVVNGENAGTAAPAARRNGTRARAGGRR